MAPCARAVRILGRRAGSVPLIRQGGEQGIARRWIAAAASGLDGGMGREVMHGWSSASRKAVDSPVISSVFQSSE
jgi:hypothetical protein